MDNLGPRLPLKVHDHPWNPACFQASNLRAADFQPLGALELTVAIKMVWIEEGCILCNACDSECPEVFLVADGSCLIKGSVREDGVEDENREARSPLKVGLQTSLEAGIKAAASACPVEVIKYE